MGRTERKLKKKTRLERQQIYIDRLGQFNTNAMHEVGKLAMGLRHYAAGESWDGHHCTDSAFEDMQGTKYTVWKGELDGPELARKILTSLGLPWDLVPTGDPVQPGRDSIMKSLATEMRKDEEGREPDDRSEYGRYEGDKVVPLEPRGEEYHKTDDETHLDEFADTPGQAGGEPPKGVPPAANSRGEGGQ